MKTILLGLSLGTSLSVISWMMGIIFNGIFAKTAFYGKLSHLNFIRSKTLNKNIGLEYFKWFVKHSFFKYLNQKIKVESKNTDLKTLRYEMSLAEISHLVGFVFVAFFAIYYGYQRGLVVGVVIMIPNAILNLYPSLLQQENKRKIDLLIRRQNLA